MQEEEQKEEEKYPLKFSLQMIKFKSLKQSRQFVKILGKKKINNKYFTIFFDKNINNKEKDINKYLNISFVMKKKTGNAVTRNKIKRKLKSAVQKITAENWLTCIGHNSND